MENWVEKVADGGWVVEESVRVGMDAQVGGSQEGDDQD